MTIKTENDITIYEADEGLVLQRIGTDFYYQGIILGKYDSIDNYIEVEKPEPIEDTTETEEENSGDE